MNDRPSSSPAVAAWPRGAVLYQVYPRSFADTDGDGVGDLNGITAHLDHIASLGVEGIWLSPVFTSPMKDFGYDVADYRDIDPVFGTLADFDRLIAAAHARGLKLIIDQVYAHTSDRHPWFGESRADRTGARADWYVWADARPDGGPPSNWQSVFGGPAWTWDARRGQYFMHNFLASQPQLNAALPAVQDALLDVMRFWLDRGVDGFRLDAINFAMHDPALTDNPPAATPGPRTRPFDFQQHLHNQSQPGVPAFLSRLRALCDETARRTGRPRYLVGEVPGEREDEEMRLYTAGTDRLNAAYGFRFLYADRLTPERIAEGPGRWTPRDGWPAWAFSNHDAPRAVSRWAHGRDPAATARLCLLLLICLRGDLFLYQGEELGLPQAEVPRDRLVDPEAIANWPLTLGRDGARTPMPWRSDAPHAGFSTGEPWLPVDPRHILLAVDVQEADPGSLLNLTRRLIALRRSDVALREGDMTILPSPPGLSVFRRGEGPATRLCVFNLGDGPVDWSAPDGWRVIESVNLSTPGSLPPLGGVILGGVILGGAIPEQNGA